MGRVLTSNVGLALAPRPNRTTRGSVWAGVEPNTITRFGAETTQVARAPISPNRLEQRGVTTDLDAGVEFEEDLTFDALRNIIEGFIFAMAQNGDVSGLIPSAAVANGYTLPAGDRRASPANSLWWASGFATAANNGLKVQAANVAADAVALALGAQNAPLTSIVAEANPPARARVSFCGYRIAQDGVWAWDTTNRRATLTLAGLGATLRDSLQLLPGMLVHFGSIGSRGDDVVRGLTGVSPTRTETDPPDGTGYARVQSITDDSIIFDRVGPALRDAGTTASATPTDMLFGEFIRNVPAIHADFLQQPFDFEAIFPDLITSGNTDEPGYEYADENYCNSLAFGLPLTNKVTMTVGFVGSDAAAPSDTQRNSGVIRRRPARNEAFNTSNDYARLHILEEDEDGMLTDFKDITVTITNNVSGDKIQGRLGNKYINVGLFNMVVEGTALFTSPVPIQAIRDNTPGIGMEIILKGRDGVIGIDMPNLSMGGGGREYPVGEAVRIAITARAVEDPDLSAAVGVSLIPVPLPETEVDLF